MNKNIIITIMLMTLMSLFTFGAIQIGIPGANNIVVPDGGNLTVDGDTFHVDGTNNQVIFSRNLPSLVTSEPVMEIKQVNAGDDQAVLEVTQDGNGPAVSITSALYGLIVNSGYVGIGTAAPTRLLHLKSTSAAPTLLVEGDAGGITLDSQIIIDADDDARIYFFNNGSSKFALISDRGNNDLRLSNASGTSAYNFVWYQNGDAWVRGEFDVGGYVGIGTTNPTKNLQVVDATTHVTIGIVAGTTFESRIDFGDSDDADIGRIRYDHQTDTFEWSTNATPAMTLDNTGDLDIVGTLSKGAGTFTIDHPLDPTNQILQHSFVESPEMRNTYYGQAVTIDNVVTITLPNWWQALNGYDKSEYTYQLTPIGSWCQLYVSEEISNNRFAVTSNDKDCKFSWTISGIRHDAYAENNRVQVEMYKPDVQPTLEYYEEILETTNEYTNQTSIITVEKSGLDNVIPKRKGGCIHDVACEGLDESNGIIPLPKLLNDKIVDITYAEKDKVEE